MKFLDRFLAAIGVQAPISTQPTFEEMQADIVGALEQICRARCRDAIRVLDDTIREARTWSQDGYAVNPAFLADRAMDVRNILVKASGGESE